MVPGEPRLALRRHRKVIVVLAVSIALALSSLGIDSASASTRSRLALSLNPDRSNAVRLDGSTVKGQIYVFVRDVETLNKVDFYLDSSWRTRTPVRTDTEPPFDFAGTAADGTAVPYDTKKLADGSHGIKVVLTWSDGTTSSRRANFTVANGVTTTPTTAPSATTTAAPTTTPTTAPSATTTAAPTTTVAGSNAPIVRGFMTAKLGQVTNTMLSDMKSVWGANVIRLQMYPREMASAQGKTLEQAWPSILTTLDDTVSRANAVGLKVIVDMHQAPFPYPISERTTDLWNSPDLEPYFVDAWNRIATKLKPRSAGIWGFDLFNEPEIIGQSTAPAQWRPLATKLTQNIHGIAPDIWVIWDPGPNGQAKGYVNLTPLPDRKVIYTAHDYRPHEFTHQCLRGWPCPASYPYNGYNKTSRINQLKPIRDFQLKYNVPILIGEFSVIRNAPAADAVLWLTEAVEMYEANGWSWVYHAFREWNGWSLEHDNNLSNTTPVSATTDRGAVIKSAMQKNNKQ